MFNVRPLAPEYDKYHMKHYSAANEDIPLKENWSERWTTLLMEFEWCMEKLLKLEVRPDDVFLVTFMKCGTTWMQEAAWLLMNNLNYEQANTVNLSARSPFIDLVGLYFGLKDPLGDCNKTPSPRLIKTHLAANLLPLDLWKQKSKIIYVARNAKDVVVSSYHFIKGMGYWKGDLADFVDDFLNNRVMFTPYWPHTVEFWKMRNEPNIFFVTYEDMKRDLSAVLQRLCKFLERPDLNESEMKEILEHLSFEKMKENKNTNLQHQIMHELRVKTEKDFQFMRRGVVGAYKDELTPELQKRIGDWTRECLDKHNLKEEDIFGEF